MVLSNIQIVRLRKGHCASFSFPLGQLFLNSDLLVVVDAEGGSEILPRSSLSDGHSALLHPLSIGIVAIQTLKQVRLSAILISASDRVRGIDFLRLAS